MLNHFGPQKWWPADSPFEVVVGAMLTQNTNWKNVARALQNLKDRDLLDPHALFELAPEELAELLRPAGYFRLKAGRLRNFLRWLIDRFDGSLDDMFELSLSSLRDELLTINGIGPETADSILLYAGQKPTFVVDTYTHRIAVRHGWVDSTADYDELKQYFEGQFDEGQYNELHALLVRVGATYCRKREPSCDDCPLRRFLPDGGPIQPD